MNYSIDILHSDILTPQEQCDTVLLTLKRAVLHSALTDFLIQPMLESLAEVQAHIYDLFNRDKNLWAKAKAAQLLAYSRIQRALDDDRLYEIRNGYAQEHNRYVLTNIYFDIWQTTPPYVGPTNAE